MNTPAYTAEALEGLQAIVTHDIGRGFLVEVRQLETQLQQLKKQAPSAQVVDDYVTAVLLKMLSM